MIRSGSICVVVSVGVETFGGAAVDAGLRAVLERILNMDDPANYEDSDAACESIMDEDALEGISSEEHFECCELIGEWFVQNSVDERAEEDDDDEDED